MHIRTFIRRTIVASAVGGVVTTSAFALGTIGHGRLVGNASVRADYDSNIFVNSSQVDDYVFTANGAVRYIRDSGMLTMETAAGASALAFLDHSKQNTVDPFVEGKFGYQPSDKTDVRGNLSFHRNSIANEVVNDRTQSNDLMLTGSVEHLPTEKLGFRFLGNYSDSAYQTAGYSDVLSYGLGVHAVHVYSPKLKLLAGVTMLEWWTDDRAPGRRSPSSNDVRYTVGAEGELGAKLTGDASVGWVQRSFDSSGFGGDTGTLFLSSRISWAAAEKTVITLVGSQDLSVSAADQSQKALSISLNLTQGISEKLSFEGGVGVDRATFTSFNGIGNRKDDGYVLRGRLNYALKDNLEIDVSTGYRNNDSNIAVSNYDRFNFGAGVSLRF